MKVWRRITAIVLAAAVAVSPALACADFCPQSGAEVSATAWPAPNLPETADAAAMPEDCADAMNASTGSQPQSHDPDCQGCSDCPAIASVKAPTLAFANAVTVDAPSLITVDFVSPVGDLGFHTRHRPTPPANGPPLASTPITLKDILRL
jgi:hypothetical protein